MNFIHTKDPEENSPGKTLFTSKFRFYHLPFSEPRTLRPTVLQFLLQMINESDSPAIHLYENRIEVFLYHLFCSVYRICRLRR